MAHVLIFADGRALTNPLNVRNRRVQTVRDEHALKTLGPFRIASEVRNRGFSCQVIHMMAEFSSSELEEVCKKFVGPETLIVGFSTSFWMDENPRIQFRVHHIIQCARDINPNIKAIFGGPNSMNMVRTQDFDIDAIILGFGEHAFINYFMGLVNKTEIVPDSKFKDIPVFNFVEKSETFDFCNSRTVYDKSDCLDWGEPMILEVGRGCIFKCKFCSYPLTGKKKLDHIKDPGLIREELIRNYELFGLDKYILSDDTFNDSNDKLDLLYDVFTKLPFKINFSAYLRLDLLNAHRQQIDKLYEMGLTGAFFGVESFHEQAARAIGKGIVSKLAKDLLYDLKATHWKERVKIQIGLITGLPHETLESYRETEAWIRDNENCLIEKVTVAPLKLMDPTQNKFPWKSEFELNPDTYGYHWPVPSKPFNWHNYMSPVTKFSQALELQQFLLKATEDMGRNSQGGFSMYDYYHMTTYFKNKKTFEEQLQMNRFEYTKYLQSESSESFTALTQAYKTKILNL